MSDFIIVSLLNTHALVSQNRVNRRNNTGILNNILGNNHSCLHLALSSK